MTDQRFLAFSGPDSGDTYGRSGKAPSRWASAPATNVGDHRLRTACPTLLHAGAPQHERHPVHSGRRPAGLLLRRCPREPGRPDVRRRRRRAGSPPGRAPCRLAPVYPSADLERRLQGRSAGLHGETLCAERRARPSRELAERAPVADDRFHPPVLAGLRAIAEPGPQRGRWRSALRRVHAPRQYSGLVHRDLTPPLPPARAACSTISAARP